jgi:hypothetical protein
MPSTCAWSLKGRFVTKDVTVAGITHKPGQSPNPNYLLAIAVVTSILDLTTLFLLYLSSPYPGKTTSGEEYATHGSSTLDNKYHLPWNISGRITTITST